MAEVKNLVPRILNFLDEKSTYMGFIVCFVFAFIFVFTPVWQLSMLAGVLGGLFYNKMSKGALVGLTGIAAAWVLYIVIELLSSGIYTLLNQIGGIILGMVGYGWIFILVLVLIGIIFGTLGGSLGSGIRIIIDHYREKNK
jgi:hypothetical protein